VGDLAAPFALAGVSQDRRFSAVLPLTRWGARRSDYIERLPIDVQA
jgi:hypothetical protein